MKTLRQKIVLIGMLVAIGGTAQADLITVNYTGDNEVTLQIYSNIAGQPFWGLVVALDTAVNRNNWTVADSQTFDLAAGSYTAFFGVSNLPNSPGGFLAEILGGTSTLLTSSAWQVSTNGGETFGAATSYGANGTIPWGDVIVGIGNSAEWIWASDSTATSVHLLGSFTVGATSVPEPGTLALLGLGLIGLGLARRRKIT